MRPANPEDLVTREWDAVVVGTGMGGATLGYRLAQAGWQVLFVEKGRCAPAGRGDLRGDFAESFLPAPATVQERHKPLLERAGRWYEELGEGSGEAQRRLVPFLGCGAGGSSALYGMAMERLSPGTFEAWPLRYDDFIPFYQTAEELFGVRGRPDPLRSDRTTYRLGSAPEMGPANRALEAFLRGQGLHPYRLPMACAYERGTDRCQGFLDARGAKRDAAAVCLWPAVQEHGARVLDGCEVERIEAMSGVVTRLWCRRGGQRFALRGRVIVLAAGALATPCLLLRSASRDWPLGLANASGLVGRNLMRHFIDLYLVPAQIPNKETDSIKEIAFGDWQEIDGVRFGTVQSFGCLPPAGQLLAEVRQELRQDRFGGPLATLLGLATPLLRRALARRLERSLILASILEDAPRRENRVRPGGPGEPRLVLEYALSPADVERIAAFRRRMLRLLRPLGVLLLKQAEKNCRIAHACGTCRMGEDPRASVLDPSGRAHGLENLYVADASCFPSSGGNNPGLTIAANAWRIAEHLKASWSGSRAGPAEADVWPLARGLRFSAEDARGHRVGPSQRKRTDGRIGGATAHPVTPTLARDRSSAPDSGK